MSSSAFRGIIAMLVLSGSALPASAQPPPVPDTLLARLTREALTTNFAIAALTNRARAADARVVTAGALPNPMLTVGVMDLALPRFAFRQSDFTEVDVQAEQAFPWPGTLAARTQSAEAAARATTAGLEAQKRDVIVRVAEVYLRLRYVITAQELLVRQRTVLNASVQTTLSRYSVGAVSQSDPLQARVALARLDADAVDLRSEETALRAQLGYLRGRRSADTVAIAPIQPDEAVTLLASADAVHAVGPERLDEHPRVTAQLALEAAATDLAHAERLAARPEFTATARYGARPLGADFFTALVGVRLPLWRGRQPARVAQAAEAEAVAARDAVADTKANLRAEWDAATAATTAGRERINILVSRVLPSADAAVDAALRGYALGQTDVVAVLGAQQSRYQTQLDIARAVSEHLAHLIILAQLSGPEVGS